MKPVSYPNGCFFVYGTLKRGQCRERSWPLEPQRVLPAWTLGGLIDMGDYPAMVEGSDRIWGEVWEYSAEGEAAVLRVLDEIEVTNQPGVENLYDRVICTATIAKGVELDAYAYRYARSTQHAQLIAPENQLTRDVSWPVNLRETENRCS